ncbi:MAG: hypothetical protein WBD20_26000 [Pirellulaceae bacterium]
MVSRAIDIRAFGVRAVLGALIATGSAALICQQAPAQQPSSQQPQSARQTQMVEFGSGQLRPVSEFAASRAPSRQATSTVPPSAVNETLRWRPNPDLKPQPHHLPQQDVFAENDRSATAPAKPEAVPNRMRDVRTTPYYQNDYRSQPIASQPIFSQPNDSKPSSGVRQAAWTQEAKDILDEAISSKSGSVPARTVGAKQDFFGNPFGEEGSSSTASASNQTSSNQSGSTLQAPTNQQFNDFRAQDSATLPDSSSLQVHQAQTRIANQFEMLAPPADRSTSGGTAASGQESGGIVNPFRGDSGTAIELPSSNQTSPNQTGPTTLPPPAKSPAPVVEQAPAFDSLFDDNSKTTPAPQFRDAPAAAGQSNLFESLDGAEESMPAPKADSSELRDLLQSVDPNKGNRYDANESLEDLPSPKKSIDAGDATDSPSDRDEKFSNPFPKRDSEADQADRDRLQERMDELKKEGRESTNKEDLDDEESDQSKAKVADGLSCNEFRERISRETIRTLSLDISAPFRPDVFDVEEYEELKQKFESAQPVRPWTSMTGNVIVSGRLRDLAYEKAIVETGEGTMQEIQISQLSEGDLAYISQNWGLPNECRLEQVAYTPRNWQRHVMTWKASNLCHKPLYFEEVNLERYGHTAGPILQPVVSSAHFFANIAVMPYKMGIHPPSECQYALGYYRPGNCAPWIVPPVPLSLRGAAAQAAAVTTGFLLIP